MNAKPNDPNPENQNHYPNPTSETWQHQYPESSKKTRSDPKENNPILKVHFIQFLERTSSASLKNLVRILMNSVVDTLIRPELIHL